MASQKERNAAPSNAASRNTAASNAASRNAAPSAAAPRDAAPSAAAARNASGAKSSPSNEEIYRLIAETAYFKAKARGFEPGGEVQDWVEAEIEVRRRIDRGDAR
jgi:hypothetical protein